jgi:hypothetical protein
MKTLAINLLFPLLFLAADKWNELKEDAIEDYDSSITNVFIFIHVNEV